MKLRCTAAYRSGLGAWKPGDAVDVRDEVGELLLRDSPGSFERVAEPGPVTASGVPASDRMQRGGRVR